MRTLKGTSIDFHERRLTEDYLRIRFLKTTGPRRHRKCEDWTRCEGRVLLSPILFNLCRKYITKDALEGFGDFRIEGQVIRNVEYAGMLPLIAKEETVLQTN
jgi:hypothetical protein